MVHDCRCTNGGQRSTRIEPPSVKLDSMTSTVRPDPTIDYVDYVKDITRISCACVLAQYSVCGIFNAMTKYRA